MNRTKGRNVESPGEDPFLAGSYGSAYTRGLQRLEDEKETGVVQAVVSLKHFFACKNGLEKQSMFSHVKKAFFVLLVFRQPREVQQLRMQKRPMRADQF